MELEREFLSNLKTNLGYILTVVLTLSGIITNVLVLKIFNHRSFMSQSIYIYLTAIAYYDMTEMGLVWLYLLPNVFFTLNTIICKIITFISTILFSAASWTVTIYTIDRIFSLVWPMKIKIRKRLKFQLTVIFSVLITCIILNVPFLIYYDAAPGLFNETIYCLHKDENTRFELNVYFVTLNMLIPFIIMFSTTIVIAIRLYNIKKKLNLTKSNRREIEFTRTILTMDIFFMLFKLPVFLEMFWFDWYPHNSDSNFYFKSKFYLYLLKAISYLNNSSAFFIYLIFNRLFRGHFYALITRKGRYAPSGASHKTSVF